MMWSRELGGNSSPFFLQISKMKLLRKLARVGRLSWLSACAYNMWQQKNMQLTGSMRLKVLKRGRRDVRKECDEGSKASTVAQK